MLFHEMYGLYFQAVSAVLAEAVEGTLTAARLEEIVRERAFGESVLRLPAALKTWPLLDGELRTPLRRQPSRPLSLLEKRWLKALLLDPRIALFDPPADGLEDAAPLYRPEDFVYFDRYADGDPYQDPGYIRRFRVVLTALREHRRLLLRFQSRRGQRRTLRCVPLRLEYSAKDDKFRLLALHGREASRRVRQNTVNLARLEDCRLLESFDPASVRSPQERQETLTLLLRDQRDAMSRALLHFSHFEKETVRLGDHLYQITLSYDREDETELLIRVLSFGPMLQVTAPESFAALVRERVEKQRAFDGGNGSADGAAGPQTPPA